MSLEQILAGIVTSPGRFISVVALALASASTGAQSGGVGLPTPKGMDSCTEGDPVVSTEQRVAASLGAEYLACFTSGEKAALHSSSRTLFVPAEHAIAMSVLGGPYHREDLEAMLSTVRQQWRNFDALSERHADYIAGLNSLIKDANSQPAPIDSIKPLLVSIDRIDDRSYVVVSIREYALIVDGERVRSIKANAAAMVLQGTRLVRLDIIRELLTPSNVEDIRKQMAAWSRAVSGDSSQSMRP